jgi:hypothetical protein
VPSRLLARAGALLMLRRLNTSLTSELNKKDRARIFLIDNSTVLFYQSEHEAHS